MALNSGLPFKYRWLHYSEGAALYSGLGGSRAAEYSASEKPVNEASDRLLDVSKDRKFLEEGEYSLTKAKEEDILKNSNYKNWVIIRPYKTYNDSRLQLGVLELEQWFYRAVSGKTVVVPGNIKNLHTSLTNSKDTAQILKRIIGNSIFNGQIFQIANPQKVTWGDVIQIYSQCIEEYNGRKMKICYAKDTSDIEIAFNNKYRIKYDGLVDRTFDDSSVTFLMKGTNFSWTPLDVGLTRCVRSALMQSNRMVQNYSIEGLYDRMTGEFTCLLKIPGVKNRFKYLLHRIFRENTIKRIKYFIHR